MKFIKQRDPRADKMIKESGKHEVEKKIDFLYKKASYTIKHLESDAFLAQFQAIKHADAQAKAWKELQQSDSSTPQDRI